jgi:AraC-like DNA-binding protein
VVRYVETPAPGDLACDVVCLWALVVDGDAPVAQRVLPDACADVVWFDHRPAVVAGPATRAYLVHLPAGATVVGVRFHPGAASRWLKAPASALRDRLVELEQFGEADVPRLDRRRLGREPARALIGALASELCDRAASWRPLDPVVREVVRWSAAEPDGRVDALAGRLSASTRQLHRLCSRTVGYGPKVLQRVLRVQRALALAQDDGGRLATLAAEAGYADQAHMTREVRELCGTTPGRLLGRQASAFALSDLFAGPGARS